MRDTTPIGCLRKHPLRETDRWKRPYKTGLHDRPPCSGFCPVISALQETSGKTGGHALGTIHGARVAPEKLDILTSLPHVNLQAATGDGLW